MKTVRFGKTSLKVSKLCLGTMTLGSHDWYSTGENERVVASTLTSMVPRDRLVCKITPRHLQVHELSA